MSKHELILRTNQFIDVSCKKSGDLTIFLQVFYGFNRVEGMSDRTLIEWERDVDVLVAISSTLTLIEKSVVKLRPSEAAIQGRYEKEHT